MTAPSVRLRPMTEADEPLLLALVAESRRTELALLSAGPQRDTLLQLQHRAQMAGFRAHAAADLQIVEVEGSAIGRLFLARLDGDELRVLDIALLPEWRGRGIGGSLLRDLCTDADRQGLLASLHVEPGNPARRLYERLGFVCVARSDAHVRMERAPSATS